MRKFFLTYCIVLPFIAVGGENKILEVAFKISWGQENLLLHQYYYSPQLKDSICITKLRFYVSFPEFSGNDPTPIHTSYSLIDAQYPEKNRMEVKYSGQNSLSHINFTLGIDSITNTDGAQGGDLDPIHGMYWSWQSGYINFKLEGYTKKQKASRQSFQYHIGGFISSDNALQHLEFPVKDSRGVTIELPVDELIVVLNIPAQPSIMSPGKDAVLFAEKLKTIFRRLL